MSCVRLRADVGMYGWTVWISGALSSRAWRLAAWRMSACVVVGAHSVPCFVMLVTWLWGMSPRRVVVSVSPSPATHRARIFASLARLSRARLSRARPSALLPANPAPAICFPKRTPGTLALLPCVSSPVCALLPPSPLVAPVAMPQLPPRRAERGRNVPSRAEDRVGCCTRRRPLCTTRPGTWLPTSSSPAPTSSSTGRACPARGRTSRSPALSRVRAHPVEGEW